jgi:hypothetical protein
MPLPPTPIEQSGGGAGAARHGAARRPQMAGLRLPMPVVSIAEAQTQTWSRLHVWVQSRDTGLDTSTLRATLGLLAQGDRVAAMSATNSPPPRLALHGGRSFTGAAKLSNATNAGSTANRGRTNRGRYGPRGAGHTKGPYSTDNIEVGFARAASEWTWGEGEGGGREWAHPNQPQHQDRNIGEHERDKQPKLKTALCHARGPPTHGPSTTRQIHKSITIG